MKPTDVIKQLVGEHEGWDEIDNMIFHFYSCSKFNGKNVTINFPNGTLEVYSDDETTVEQSFSIKAELVAQSPE